MQKLEINSEVFMEPNRKNKIDEDNSNFEESLAQLDSLVIFVFIDSRNLAKF